MKKSKTRKADESPDATAGTQKMQTMISRSSTKKVDPKKPKALKSPKAQEEPVNLESPTSVTMKQSFLLK